MWLIVNIMVESFDFYQQKRKDTAKILQRLLLFFAGKQVIFFYATAAVSGV